MYKHLPRESIACSPNLLLPLTLRLNLTRLVMESSWLLRLLGIRRQLLLRRPVRGLWLLLLALKRPIWQMLL